jgi:cbb3-type cytochrome oxidase subunit 3
LAAALPKLFNIADFAAIINAYAILPGFAVTPVAVFLPLAEIALALGLIFNRVISKYLTIFLLLFFIAVLSYAVSQGLDIDCGCFGPEDPEHRAFQGLRIAIVRDVVMIFLLSYSLWYCNYRKSYK